MHKIDSLATNPATPSTMQEWIDRGQSVQKFVLDNLAAPRQDLIEFLKAFNEHPEGVDPDHLNVRKNLVVD